MGRPRELRIAREAAKEAGGLLLDLFGKTEAVSKADRSLVTEADRKAEEGIRDRLRGAFPEYAFLGEEGGYEEGAGEYAWLVDPLDGTTNYVVRNPFFSVSIALAFRGDPILGVVYFPFCDELFSAEKGSGAFLGEERIHVSQGERLEETVLAFCNGRDRESVDRIVQIFGEMKPITNKFRQMGSASLELSFVACGRVDAFLMVGANSWDVAAGALLVREAGGVVTNFSGRPYRVTSREILASNGGVHGELLKIVGTS
jgi:myo-inositol-1(or 4)-monophosphatase